MELFHSHEGLDLSSMRASSVRSKKSFVKMWNSSKQPFYVKYNKPAVEFIRDTVMADAERDKKPGVYVLLEKDTRLYTYPPIKMCSNFTRVFVGLDKTKEHVAYFQAFLVEALQELYPGQREEIVKRFPFQNWERVSEFAVLSIFGK